MLNPTKHKNFPFTKWYIKKKNYEIPSVCLGTIYLNFFLEMTKIYLYFEKNFKTRKLKN